MIGLLCISLLILYSFLVSFSIYNTYIYFLEETELHLMWEDDWLTYWVDKSYWHFIYLFKVLSLQVFIGIVTGKVKDIEFWN